LRLYRHNGVSWENVTGSRDLATHTITSTELTSLSKFAIGYPNIGGVLLMVR
jgi:hypothetical protein